ncbi:hypothetical protein Tco_0699525 [Tanacetum coccineum]
MLTLEKYLAWVQDDIRPGVVKSKIGNDVEFEINRNFMRELRHKLFKGTDDKDAHEHVRMVLEIVDLFHFPGVTFDVVMLRVFPITLKGPALRRINRLSAGLVTTWDLIKKAFISKYCPPFKTTKKLEIIRNFKQEVDKILYHAWERYNDLLYRFMAEHSHDWYDETTIRGRINDSSDNVDAIQSSFKGAHLTKVCSLKKRARKLSRANSNIRELKTTTKNLQEKAYQLTQTVLTDTCERTTIDKENVKDPVPHNLPVVQTYVPPTQFLGSPYRTRETIYAIGIPEEIQKEEGNMNDGCDITVKDVERLRKVLIPSIHILLNLELIMQPYMSLGLVYNKAKVKREEEQDYDIPL